MSAARAFRLVPVACLLALAALPAGVAGAAGASWVMAAAGVAADGAPATAHGTDHTLVSDPDALPDAGDPAPRDAASGPAHRAHTLSSDRARSAPRPSPPADPLRVLPPVIVPQIQLPATGAPASVKLPAGATSVPKLPAGAPSATAAPAGTPP